MDISGETLIPAPRAEVWQALNDPEILRQSIVGCDHIEKLSETELTAKVTAKIGPVKASFTGKVTLSEIDPPNGYRITGEGNGGVAGFAKGGAVVKLSDATGGTLLSYTVDAQIGGKLAQLGSRLIESTARSYSQEFFNRFSSLVADPNMQESDIEILDGQPLDVPHEAVAGDVIESPDILRDAPQPDEAAAMDAAMRQTRSLSPGIWIGGTLLLLGIIVYLAIWH